MEKKNPLFSIITVSYNSAKTIEKTIISVLNQTSKDFEYIIIDGGSTDGTIDIIKKYKDNISYWVSEKDGGIYDAMNKGTSISRGKYLNFMNSDDYFFSNYALEESTPFLNGEYDIVYGNMEVRNKNLKFIKVEPLPKYLWMGPVNHQSSFIKRETMERYKYNTKNKLVADFEFFLTVYYNNGKILKIDNIIASYSTEGISGIKHDQVMIDCRVTSQIFENKLKVEIYYKLLPYVLFIKKIIPYKLYLPTKNFIKDIFVKF